MDEYEGPSVTIEQIVTCESCGIIDMAADDDVLTVALRHRRWHQEAKSLPTVAELIGSDPGLTGGLSAVDYQRKQRGG